MCMCGGILEVGLACAIVGYVGKKLHKCKCECHEEVEHTCKHCDNHKKGKTVKIEKPKKNYYKIIQYVLTLIIAVGMCMLAYGVVKNCFMEHKEHKTYHPNIKLNFDYLNQHHNHNH